MFNATIAASQVGKKKQTIIKAIKTGRMSAKKNGKGQWEIAPSELFRVYPKPVKNKSALSEKKEVHQTENKFLKEKIELLEKTVSNLEAGLKRETEQCDHWRLQATSLLTDQRQREEKRILSFPERVKDFWYGNVPKNEKKAATG